MFQVAMSLSVLSKSELVFRFFSHDSGRQQIHCHENVLAASS